MPPDDIDALYRQYAQQQGWMPGPGEVPPPPPDKGAHLMFDGAIPAGTIPDVGEIQVTPGAPGNRQATSQIVNGAPVGKDPSQMTPEEFAAFIESQGGRMPVDGKPPGQLEPAPADQVAARVDARDADINQRKADAQAEKDAIAKVNAGGGAATPAPRGAGGPMVVPGGWRRTVSGDVLAGEDQLAGDRQAHAVDREIDQQLVNQQYQAHLTDRAADLQAEQDIAREEMQRQQAAQQKAEGDYNAAAKAAAAAHVDPKAAFGEDGVGGILAAIGVGLGGAASALLGGPNQALQLVNAQIDRSMQAQEKDMQNKRTTADNLLARLKEQTGSMEAAKVAFKRSGLMYAQNQLDQLNAGQQSVDLRNALSKELDTQQAQNLDFRMRTEQFVPPRLVGGVAGAADKDQDRIFEGPDGKRYVARNTASRDSLAEAGAALKAFKENADELDRLREDLTTFIPGTDNYVKAQTLGQAMVFQTSTLNKLGAISKDDREMVNSTLGDPTAITSRAGAKGRQYAAILDRGFQEKLRAEAVNQVQTGNKIDQRGQLAPTAVYTGQSPTAPPAMPGSFKKVQ